jgi:hypothetical protein
LNFADGARDAFRPSHTTAHTISQTNDQSDREILLFKHVPHLS